MLIESMELVRLPSPPHLLGKLLDVCHDPESTIPDLADLISTDAALTGKLLMAVNSAAFAISEPIDTLPQAITLLGHDLVKTMVLTSSMQQLFAGLINTQKEFVCNAWLDSLYCAVFAREIAQSLNYEFTRDAYLAGLLHDLGQIVFDAKFHEQYVSIMASKTEAETINKEVAHFGLAHTELGATIIEQWPSLSPAIADAVRFHHEDEEQLKGCDLLCQIVAEAGQLALYWSRHGKAEVKWHSDLVDDKELKYIYAQVQDKVSVTAAALGIPLPKSGCLTQNQFSMDMERETIRLARKIRDASLIKVINPEATRIPIVNSPRGLLLRIAREMQLLFAISDVALLFPDEDNFGLLALYEVKHIQPLSKFSIANNNSQIIRSFRDKTPYWIEPEKGRDQITSLPDRQIIRRLNHEIAYCLPLGHGDQIIGTVILGSNPTHKRYLDSLSNFISGYLKNIADLWSQNRQLRQQQAFEEKTKKDQGQKEIDKLIHEISNPLSVIGNYIDILKSNLKSSGAGSDKEIKVLKEELERIGNIVLDFKDAKNSESPTVFLNDELKTCIPLYVKSINSGNEVKINWSLDESECEIQIPRDGLRQIVLNLVKNAIEAQSKNAELSVSSHHFVNIDGVAFAQFTISDRGKGVDAITRHRLFSPITSSKEGFSRGLGLSVVADILSHFNGQIKYFENDVGGASFEVSIPLQLTKSPDN